MAELLKIDLNLKPIHGVLQWIEGNRMSCVVTISLNQGNEINLCMEEGRVVYVSSGAPGYRLGEYLVASGDLTEQALNDALDRSRVSGVSLSRYLTDQGLVAAARLGEALEQLVEQILIDVFVSNNGSVAVTSPLPAVMGNSPIRLETGRIIADALRIFDEMNRSAGTSASA